MSNVDDFNVFDAPTRAQMVDEFKSALITEFKRRNIPFVKVDARDFDGQNLDLWLYPEESALSAVFSYSSWGWLRKRLKNETWADIAVGYVDRYFKNILSRYTYELKDHERAANGRDVHEHHREEAKRRIPVVKAILRDLQQVKS